MKIIKNMGITDRFLRIAAAIGMLLLSYSGIISGTLSIVTYVVAGVFVITSLAGTCPLYIPLGIKTKK